MQLCTCHDLTSIHDWIFIRPVTLLAEGREYCKRYHRRRGEGLWQLGKGGGRGFHFLKLTVVFKFFNNFVHLSPLTGKTFPPQFSVLNTQKLYFRSYSQQILDGGRGGIANGIAGGGGTLYCKPKNLRGVLPPIRNTGSWHVWYSYDIEYYLNTVCLH